MVSVDETAADGVDKERTKRGASRNVNAIMYKDLEKENFEREMRDSRIEMGIGEGEGGSGRGI